MKAVEIMKIFSEAMKVMSKVGIRMDDYRHLEIWEEYCALMAKNQKKTYVIAMLAMRHKISERTLIRLIKRLEKDV